MLALFILAACRVHPSVQKVQVVTRALLFVEAAPQKFRNVNK
jgi:hypothetical protein